jgi:hypothetical protein
MRPALHCARREGMTEQPMPAPGRDPALMRSHAPNPTSSKDSEPTVPDNPTMMRRSGPASRPSGRSAVGLRPSLDPDPYLDALRSGSGTKKRADPNS